MNWQCPGIDLRPRAVTALLVAALVALAATSEAIGAVAFYTDQAQWLSAVQGAGLGSPEPFVFTLPNVEKSDEIVTAPPPRPNQDVEDDLGTRTLTFQSANTGMSESWQYETQAPNLRAYYWHLYGVIQPNNLALPPLERDWDGWHVRTTTGAPMNAFAFVMENNQLSHPDKYFAIQNNGAEVGRLLSEGAAQTLPKSGLFDFVGVVSDAPFNDAFLHDAEDSPDNFSLREVRFAFGEPPQPPVQKVYLAIGEDVPWGYHSLPNEFGTFLDLASWEVDESLTMPAATSFQVEEVHQLVQEIYEQAGVTKVEFTRNPTDAAYAVYFTFESPVDSLGGVARELIGRAAIFLGEVQEQPGNLTANIAETVAHEVGHLFHLRHINPYTDGREVMDSRLANQDGTLPTFTREPASMSELPVLTHNPAYVLRRFVDGLTTDQLLDESLVGGSYDHLLAGEFRQSWEVLLNGPEAHLYDVHIYAKEAGMIDSPIYSELFSSPEMSVLDLANLTLNLAVGGTFTLVASSAPGTDPNIGLSSGDPMQNESYAIPITPGSQSLSLVRLSDDGMEYSFLAGVTLTGSVVPEPSTITFLAFAIASWCIRRPYLLRQPRLLACR